MGFSGAPQARTMNGAAIGLVATLITIYVISQFLRNSIGVIAPDLAREVSLSASEIGLLSSTFFFVFALAQIPVGVALDRFGPRLCLLTGAAITIAGALVFAAATSPAGLIAGRVLLGIGCSASFMAPLAIYAQRFPPERFATLTGLQLGIGSFGTLFATAPLAVAAASFGWRNSFLAVALITLAVGLLVAWVVRIPPPARHKESWQAALRESLGGVGAVLRTPHVGVLFLMHLTAYSSFALIVGLWGAPYLSHVYGYGTEARGNLLLLAAFAQIVGSMAWGPTDRWLSSFKIPVLIGAGLTAALLCLLGAFGTLPDIPLLIWFVAFGFMCAYVPVLISHGRSLFPAHLVGRGITLLNMGTIGGVFVAQTISGIVIDLFPKGPEGSYSLDAYRVVFALQGLAMILSCLLYLRVPEPRRAAR